MLFKPDEAPRQARATDALRKMGCISSQLVSFGYAEREGHQVCFAVNVLPLAALHESQSESKIDRRR